MKNVNNADRSKSDMGLSPAEIVIPSLLGIGVGIAVSAVLLFIVGAIIYSTSDPNKLVLGASLVILGISSFVVGFAGSKRSGSLLSGFLSGLVFMFLLWTAALISGGQGSIPAPYSYLVRLGGLLVSLLGAFLASRNGRGPHFASSPKVPKIKKR